jgi:integrase
MFHRFCSWLRDYGKGLDQCNPGDIAQFLDTANPNLPPSRRTSHQQSRQRQQYIRILERVLNHLGTMGLAIPNAARLAAFDGVGHGKDRPTRFLTLAEQEAVLRLIDLHLKHLQTTLPAPETWVAARDLALVATVLGAGLKVQNVCGLTLNCINLTEGRIDLSRPRHAHRARILPFANEPLRLWLQIRADNPLEKTATMNVPLVFPADRDGPGFGRHAKTPALHASSVYRRVLRFLGEAGITGERASAQTLRNTYAGLLIEGGANDEQLVDYLGLSVSITARRLRAAYLNWKVRQDGESPEESTNS